MLERSDKYVWFIAAACLFSLILFLGLPLFNTKGEPREAIVALSMFQSGNWILPVNNGVDIAYKPPLLHWCIAVISMIAGEVTQFTSRLPSALSLTAMVFAGYSFHKKHVSSRVAFLTAMITLTFFEVHRAGMACRVDMLLSSLMVISLYLLYSWCTGGMRGIPVAAVLCMGGAMLTKGPVGLILPCLVVFVFMLLRGNKFLRILPKFCIIAVLSCLLPLAWYIPAYMQGGNDFLQLVLEENILRFAGKMSYSSHVKPVSYNFITILSGTLPYSLFVLLSLFSLRLRRINIRCAGLSDRLRSFIRNLDDARLFSLVSIVVIFIFYCIPKSKRSVYLLPVYPFIAFFIAEYMIYTVRYHRNVFRIFGNVMSFVALLLPLLFLLIRFDIGNDYWDRLHPFVNVLAGTSLDVCSVISVFLPVAASAIFIVLRGVAGMTLIYSVVGVIFSIFMSLDGFYLPAILNSKSDHCVAMKIKDVVPEGTVYSYRTDILEGNRMHPFTINFYLGNRVVPFETQMPDKGYLISGNDDVNMFRKTYPAYITEEVYDFRHKSCDDGKYLHLYKFYRK